MKEKNVGIAETNETRLTGMKADRSNMAGQTQPVSLSSLRGTERLQTKQNIRWQRNTKERPLHRPSSLELPAPYLRIERKMMKVNDIHMNEKEITRKILIKKALHYIFHILQVKCVSSLIIQR